MRTDALTDEVFAGVHRHLVTFSPVTATRMGDHGRDEDLDEWGDGAVDERLADLSALAGKLADGRASAAHHGDGLLLADTIASMRFQLEELRLPVADPTFYLDIATSGVHDLLRRDDLPAPPRRAAARRRAAQVPRLLDQARGHLTAVPAPHRELALLRVPGAARLYRDTLPAFAPEAAEAGEAAAAACERFGAWLGEAHGASVPDWRLGGERWGRALRLALGSRLAGEQLWQRGWLRLDELQEEAERLASRVVGGEAAGVGGAELVRTALHRVADDRPDREGLVPAAARALEPVAAFLAESDEFDLPDPAGLRVEALPPFEQGAAVAYFRPAPPLEPAAPHTYYLSPVPAGWDDERAESFLREYNHHALASIGIHEAFPGHYAQFAAAQRNPSAVRRTLWNSACAEGWAVYAERQVAAAGFGGPAFALTSTKMQLRVVANALLDQALHVHGWDDGAALDLLVDRAYQEHAEATGKLLRAKVTAGQLSTYFVGGEEFADLRTDVAAARGAAFEARDFHAEVLAEGVPPVAVLRAALLG